MIQYMCILLLLGSTYVSNTNSEFSSITMVEYIATTETTTAAAATSTGPKTTKKLSSDNATISELSANRNARNARLLEGETMGGLIGCDSFTIGDVQKKEFYSPNYPKEYSSQLTCIKVITADSRDEQVILDFRDQFKMEPSENCKFDVLEIRDGANGYSSLISTHCGHQFPPQIRSTGPSLWLRFKSDENIEYEGFRAVYWFEKRKNIDENELNEEPCVVNKTEIDGNFTLTSKEIPQYYLNKANRTGMECLFQIFVAQGKLISLSWDEFRLEHPNDCELNYVYILDANSDTIKQTFCGAAAEPILFENSKLQIQYVVKKAAINSTFTAHFTPFKKADNGNCSDDEFNCQDNYCIDKSLQCNGENNCLTASDEDDEECKKRNQESFWTQIMKIDLLIILIVFFFILFGMCFTLIFNVARKLIHDFSVIKEHVNQSRESQLDQLGRKTPTATLLTPMATVLPSFPDKMLNSNEIRTSAIVQESSQNDDDEENECYVPTEHTFPNLIRHEYGFERINGGPQYHHNACQTRSESIRYNGGDEEEDGLATNQSGDYSYMPQMRDNECQTRESLFLNTTNSVDVVGSQKSGSPSTQPASGTSSRRGNASQATTAKLAVAAANALPPVAEPTIGFTTFGKKPDRTSKPCGGTAKEHRFRAEAVIEVERFRSPKRDVGGTENAKSNRPYSVQSTKSAPDVIVTH